MGLTVISGIIDAVSYLGLGRLFLGKMTGNVVVLGSSTARVPGFSLAAGGLALSGFLLGAAGGGRLHTALGHARFRWVSTALVIEAAALTGLRGTEGVHRRGRATRSCGRPCTQRSTGTRRDASLPPRLVACPSRAQRRKLSDRSGCRSQIRAA